MTSIAHVCITGRVRRVNWGFFLPTVLLNEGFPNMLKPRGNTKPWLLNGHRKALHCLENKVYERSSPVSPDADEGIIRLDDLFNYKPEKLPGAPDNGERRRYFTRRISVNGGQKRSSEFGRWHARDGRQEIRDLEGRPLGFVQHLIYMQGGSPGKKTKWAMIEYTLASSRIPPGVNELALCIIHKTKDYKRNGTTSSDVGPSNNPSSEPVLQAENQVPELTDLPFSDWFASMMQAENQGVELTDLPFSDWFASMEFPRDSVMDWVNDPWFEHYYGHV